ncbi:(R)-mandelonitrile lyase [Dirofilaria immitis]
MNAVSQSSSAMLYANSITVEGFIIDQQKQQDGKQANITVTRQRCFLPVASSIHTLSAKSISQDRADELLDCVSSSRLTDTRLAKKLDTYSFSEQLFSIKNR